MKKIFLTRRNTLLASPDALWSAVACIIAVAAFLLRILAPSIFWYAFSPVFRAADALAAGSHAFVAGFGDRAALVEKNEQLTNENTVLANENSVLLKKTTALSGLFSSQSKANVPGISAGVVARPPESPYDILVLAAGTNEGVALGMEAFGEGNVPLGVVGSVSAHFSRITLFSAPGMSIGGWVGRADLSLIIKGAGAGAMNASVARSAGIAVGDSVFAPGPGMLPIGVVTRIDGEPSSPSVLLRIMPAVNLFSAAWVELRDTGAAFSAPATTTLP